MHSQPSPQTDTSGSLAGLPGWVPASPVADEGLLEGLRAGDEASYELLVRHHGPRMLAVAVRLLRDEDRARDAVQDAFLSAYRSIGKFREGSQLATWLHRITVNAALMRIRHSARRPEVELEELPEVFDASGHRAIAPHRAPAEAETRLLEQETRRQVRRAIDRLPATYRTVLLLRDIEELDTAEVAGMLGISANAVKIRLHRARQALARELAGSSLGSEL